MSFHLISAFIFEVQNSLLYSPRAVTKFYEFIASLLLLFIALTEVFVFKLLLELEYLVVESKSNARIRF